jgi:anthranilate phosphoribosyltransferase
VLLNAGFCAVLAGRAADPAQGVALARRAVVSGDALATLERLAEASQKLAREAS